MKLWRFLRERMLRYPWQLVCENSAEMSYEELVIFAESFSKKLQGQSCCAIYCQSEMATCMALLGCFAAGVTAVPLSSRYGEIHCNKILDTISPSCIITDHHSELKIYRIIDSKYIVPPKHPALIMCTSGTTGTPKGAMLSENNIITNVCDISHYFKISSNDSILISRPLYHSAVLTGELLTALANGTKIRFYSDQFNPVVLLELLAEHKITTFCGTPTMLNILSHFLSNTNGIFLKHVTISGECMGNTTGQHIRNVFPDAQIYHVYGLTEASPRVSYLPPEYYDDEPSCVGVPLQSVKIKITDRAGNQVPDGTEGLLWVRGANIMLGYYNDPSLTRQVMQNKWLCTGDIAYKNKNGWLKIKGRADDMIIRAGMNVYPQEIEEALKKDLRTKEVLVYGIPDANNGARIAMKISGSYKNTDEVKQLCMKELPSFQVPTLIELVEELPRNGSGKTIRSNQHAGI